MKLKTSKESGFTLLEIMLVVMIIAVLMGSAIYLMGGNVGIAQDVRAHADIQAIDTQLKLYQTLNGFAPSTEQGLQALVAKPDSSPIPTEWHQFMTKMPQDPWHHPYIYENPGKHNPNGYDIYSAGSSGQPGTGTDIGNWDDNSTQQAQTK